MKRPASFKTVGIFTTKGRISAGSVHLPGASSCQMIPFLIFWRCPFHVWLFMVIHKSAWPLWQNTRRSRLCFWVVAVTLPNFVAAWTQNLTGWRPLLRERDRTVCYPFHTTVYQLVPLIMRVRVVNHHMFYILKYVYHTPYTIIDSNKSFCEKRHKYRMFQWHCLSILHLYLSSLKTLVGGQY
jgi:hypothetical protein